MFETAADLAFCESGCEHVLAGVHGVLEELVELERGKGRGTLRAMNLDLGLKRSSLSAVLTTSRTAMM